MLLRLKELTASGVYANLITPMQDRLGRNALDAITTSIAVWDGGHVLHFTSEGGACPRTPDNEMLFTIRAAFAQKEVSTIRMRIRTTLDDKRQRGLVVGTVPYGWSAVATGETHRRGDTLIPTRKLVVNDQEFAVLKLIVSLRAPKPPFERREGEGWGWDRIATELNRRGIQTKTPAGHVMAGRNGGVTSGEWQGGTIRNMAKNRYVQQFFTGKESV
jgi:hypothetical protein